MLKKRTLGEVGDTLVEVMLAMAIVASVLGAAYATASRSLRTGRQAQERSEALRQVESQIEQLKLMAPNKTVGAAPFIVGNSFCVVESPLLTTADSGDVRCKKSDLYTIKIKYSPSAPADPTTDPDDRFSVTAEWDRLGGGPNEELTVWYKLHPGVE